LHAAVKMVFDTIRNTKSAKVQAEEERTRSEEMLAESAEAKRRLEVLLEESSEREQRMVELKQEVNDLLEADGQETKYSAPRKVKELLNRDRFPSRG